MDVLWGEYKRIIKDHGAILLFAQMPFGADLITSNAKMFRYKFVWNKKSPRGFLNANRMPLRVHEDILVFYKKLPVYHPQWNYGEPYRTKSGLTSCNYGKYTSTITVSDGKRYPVDIIEFSNASHREKSHPTQKPVDLLEYLIRTYTNRNAVVLDNCMGSGSTCVAAINTDRKYIGYELDHEYFETAKARIAEAEEKHANGERGE